MEFFQVCLKKKKKWIQLLDLAITGTLYLSFNCTKPCCIKTNFSVYCFLNSNYPPTLPTTDFMWAFEDIDRYQEILRNSIYMGLRNTKFSVITDYFLLPWAL